MTTDAANNMLGLFLLTIWVALPFLLWIILKISSSKDGSLMGWWVPGGVLFGFGGLVVGVLLNEFLPPWGTVLVVFLHVACLVFALWPRGKKPCSPRPPPLTPSK